MPLHISVIDHLRVLVNSRHVLLGHVGCFTSTNKRLDIIWISPIRICLRDLPFCNRKSKLENIFLAEMLYDLFIPYNINY